MTLPDRVIATIAKELGEQHLAANRCHDIKPGHLLAEDVGCNSMDLLCITVALDEEFGIEIADVAVEGWRTVGDVIASVVERVGRNIDQVPA